MLISRHKVDVTAGITGELFKKIAKAAGLKKKG